MVLWPNSHTTIVNICASGLYVSVCVFWAVVFACACIFGASVDNPFRIRDKHSVCFYFHFDAVKRVIRVVNLINTYTRTLTRPHVHMLPLYTIP